MAEWRFGPGRRATRKISGRLAANPRHLAVTVAGSGSFSALPPPFPTQTRSRSTVARSLHRQTLASADSVHWITGFRR